MAQVSLAERIQSKDAKIAIVGLGYVGLPLAVVFAENGFENTSIANICSKAKVSKGLVYHHFKSKEAILIEKGW